MTFNEIFINGVRYVPVASVSPRFDNIIRALLESYWGEDTVEGWSTEELQVHANRLWVRVYDDNDEGSPPTVLDPTVLEFVTDVFGRLAQYDEQSDQ